MSCAGLASNISSAAQAVSTADPAKIFDSARHFVLDPFADIANHASSGDWNGAGVASGHAAVGVVQAALAVSGICEAVMADSCFLPTIADVMDLGDAASAVGGGGIPDSAVVVRGGSNTAEQLIKGAESVAPDGTLAGVSVNAGDGMSVEELSSWPRPQDSPWGIPHGKVGVTTAGEIRGAGGGIVADPLPDNPYHCLISGGAAALSGVFKAQPNPNPFRC
jgi:hypothetical protein